MDTIKIKEFLLTISQRIAKIYSRKNYKILGIAKN